MSYILNFLGEILLILTYDLGLTDQTMIDVMWVIGLEVQIITCINRFPVIFLCQFRTFLHDQDVQEWKSIISFNFHCEFDGRSKGVEVVKKLLQSCWSMWSNHESIIDISGPFCGFVACCIQCHFLKVFHKYITDHRRELPIPIPCFCCLNLSSNGKYIVVKQMSSNSITCSTCKGEHSWKEGSVLSLFLMTCKTSSTGTLVNRLTTSKLTRQSSLRKLTC
jgi:hypothetical protein